MAFSHQKLGLEKSNQAVSFVPPKFDEGLGAIGGHVGCLPFILFFGFFYLSFIVSSLKVALQSEC